MLRAYGKEIANHYYFQKNINTISCDKYQREIQELREGIQRLKNDLFAKGGRIQLDAGDAGEAEGGRRVP